MDDKRRKSGEDSSKPDRTVDKDHPADSAGKPLRPAQEGPDNLRRRAEWFNRRTEDRRNK